MEEVTIHRRLSRLRSSPGPWPLDLIVIMSPESQGSARFHSRIVLLGKLRLVGSKAPKS